MNALLVITGFALFTLGSFILLYSAVLRKDLRTLAASAGFMGVACLIVAFGGRV